MIAAQRRNHLPIPCFSKNKAGIAGSVKMDCLEYNSAIKKWGNPTICNNMGEIGGHYTKWDKSYRERPILYDLAYM